MNNKLDQLLGIEDKKDNKPSLDVFLGVNKNSKLDSLLGINTEK